MKNNIYKSFIICFIAVVGFGCSSDGYTYYINSNASTTSYKIKSHSENIRLKTKITSPIELSDDGSEIIRLGKSDFVKFTDKKRSEKLYISMKNDVVDYEFYRKGQKTPLTPAEVQALNQKLFTLTPLFAKQRIANIHTNFGFERAWTQLENAENSVTRKAYVLALSKINPLSNTQQFKVIDGFQWVKGDYEMSNALRNFVKNQEQISTDSWFKLIDAIQTIGSDYELSVLMRDLVSYLPAKHEVKKRYLDASKTIGSDYEKSALMTYILNSRGDFSVTDVLNASFDVDSDYEAQKLASKVAPNVHSDIEIASFLQFIETIGSDYEMKQALTSLNYGDLRKEQIADVIRIASYNIGSDYELSEALVYIANKTQFKELLSNEFKEAMGYIGSSYYRLNVYEAL